MSASELKEIPLEQILTNPEQPRRDFDPDKLKSLAQSIQENGLQQPVTVERTEDPGHYILIDGERRWRAHKIAGLATVQAVVRESAGQNGDEGRQRLIAALILNSHREDLSAIEEGLAYTRLKDELGSYHKVSAVVGYSVAHVRGRIRLVSLDPEIQYLIAEGKLQKDFRIIDALLRIPEEQRLAVANKAAKPGLRIQDVLAICQNALVESKRKSKPAPEISDNGSAPAVKYALNRNEAPGEPMWRQLVERKLVPQWHNVQEAARLSCRKCVFYDRPSQEICGECPAVVLIEKMVEVSQK